MGKIWLKSVDPSHKCCGCESKAGPCDNCCDYFATIATSLSQAQTIISTRSASCLALSNSIGSDFFTASSSSLVMDVDIQFSGFAVTDWFSEIDIYHIQVTQTSDITIDYSTLGGGTTTYSSVSLNFRGICPTIGPTYLPCTEESSQCFVEQFSSNHIIGSAFFPSVLPGHYFWSIQGRSSNFTNPFVTSNRTTAKFTSTFPIVTYPIIVKYFISPDFTTSHYLTCT